MAKRTASSIAGSFLMNEILQKRLTEEIKDYGRDQIRDFIQELKRKYFEQGTISYEDFMKGPMPEMP